MITKTHFIEKRCAIGLEQMRRKRRDCKAVDHTTGRLFEKIPFGSLGIPESLENHAHGPGEAVGDEIALPRLRRCEANHFQIAQCLQAVCRPVGVMTLDTLTFRQISKLRPCFKVKQKKHPIHVPQAFPGELLFPFFAVDRLLANVRHVP